MADSENIRIKDIAHMAGVSIGTVDRVLHNRGRVSKKNLQKINEVLAQVNYQPNIIARSLSSKKIYQLVVIIPNFTIGEYWEHISKGIDRALADFKQYHVNVEKRYFDQFNEISFKNAIEGIKWENVDGVLIAPLFAELTRLLSKQLDTFHIPYVYIDSDLEREQRMTFVGTNSQAGGRIAAKLISKNIEVTDSILIAQIQHIGEESTQAINRQHGFLEYLHEKKFQGRVHNADLHLMDTASNEHILNNIFHNYPQIKAAVIFNSKAYVVGEYLAQKKRHDICLVGYDLIEKNEILLQNGYIEALIAQHPNSQGYEGIRALCNHLIFAKQPERTIGIPLDILILENYCYYKGYKF